MTTSTSKTPPYDPNNVNILTGDYNEGINQIKHMDQCRSAGVCLIANVLAYRPLTGATKDLKKFLYENYGLTGKTTSEQVLIDEIQK